MKKTLYVFLLGSLLTSCASDSEDDLLVEIDTNQEITYKNDVKKIMDQSCATSFCHSSSNRSGGLVLETYEEVKTAVENRGVISRMKSTSSPMPASGNLSDATIAIVEKWKEQNYIN